MRLASESRPARVVAQLKPPAFPVVLHPDVAERRPLRVANWLVAARAHPHDDVFAHDRIMLSDVSTVK